MSDLVKAPPREIASAFQASGLFPDSRSEAQAYVKVIAGQELGIGPMAAMAGINVIQGKVTLSANLLASQVKRHPAYSYRVKEHTNTVCRIEFTEDGEAIGLSEFSVEDAQRAGVAGGQNWKKYPKAMLFARALTQGVRWYCPDVTSGSPAYVPEELGGAESVEPEVVEAEIVPPKDDSAPKLLELKEQMEKYEFPDDAVAGVKNYIRTDAGVDHERVDDLLKMFAREDVPRVLRLAGVEA